MSSLGCIGSYYTMESYTGTKSTPATLSFFIVPGIKVPGIVDLADDISIAHKNPVIHQVGYILIFSIIGGMARVGCSLIAFSKHIKNISLNKDDPHLKKCWNAFQNFIRGIIEIIPLTGLFLVIYDIFCNSVLIENKIKAQIKDYEKKGKPILGMAGIAFDGKISTFCSLQELVTNQDLNNLTDEKKLDILISWMDEKLNQHKEQK